MQRSPETSAVGHADGLVERRRVDIVAGIFARLFDLDGVPADADFFRLGGDSMLAEQFVLEIENRFGIVLSPSVLVEAPTPLALAGIVGRAGGGNASPLFVAREGRGPPICCVHGNGGTSLLPSRIVPALGGDNPVYGLRAIGLEDGERPLTSVGTMAARYLEAIDAHAKGDEPYVLVGHCCGAVAAHEMARQLVRRGRPAAALVLIDPDTKPSYVPYLHQSGLRLALTRLQLAWRVRRRGAPPEAGRSMSGSARRRSVSRTFKMAVARHRPGRVDCPALLIHTPPRRAALRDPKRGYPALLGDVRFVEIDVAHDRMFHDRIREIAALIEQLLGGTAAGPAEEAAGR
jgi:thioesterase domain-containing protein/acyl carrier protein